MKLTGKCKKAFEKWYFEVYCVDNDYGLLRFFALKTFYEDAPSEQYGVYIDFFDTVRLNCTIELNVNHELEYDGLWVWTIVEDLDETSSGFTDDRPKSRENVIKEVNKIYNGNKK